jgi:hypothetical protein
MMRHTARKASNWYLHTHKEDKDLTVEDIREMIEADDAAVTCTESVPCRC